MQRATFGSGRCSLCSFSRVVVVEPSMNLTNTSSTCQSEHRPKMSASSHSAYLCLQTLILNWLICKNAYDVRAMSITVCQICLAALNAQMFDNIFLPQWLTRHIFDFAACTLPIQRTIAANHSRVTPWQLYFVPHFSPIKQCRE